MTVHTSCKRQASLVLFVLGSSSRIPVYNAASPPPPPPHDVAALAFPRRPTPRRNERQLRRRRGPSSTATKRSRPALRPPPSSGAASLFTVNKILPPLDITELPASPASNNHNSTTLAGPYAATTTTQQQWYPSLRQRDDPDDLSCIPHVCGPLSVTYTNSPKIVERWLGENVPSSHHPSFLGFDVESVPDAPWVTNRALFMGPATVQLSTPDACLVVHLTRNRGERKSNACPALAALLSDESIIKVCTGIDDDMLELYRWSNRHLQARSRFDLGGVGCGISAKSRIGLKRLVRAVLGVEMRKSRRLATSDWSRWPLTYPQLAYSARDAWAGAAVMHDLSERHPSVFGPDAVMELVGGERSMHELHERAVRRKEARVQLKEVHHQFRRYSSDMLDLNDEREERRMKGAAWPPLVVEEKRRLQGILTDTSPDGLIGFDAEPLGLAFTSELK